MVDRYIDRGTSLRIYDSKSSWTMKVADNGPEQPTSSRLAAAMQSAMRGMGQLNSTLPTGTALVFQFLLPIITTNGKCPAGVADKWVTGGVLVLCALACFFISFTDTYSDSSSGKSYYGLVTRRGLWLLPEGAAPAQVAATAACASEYALRFSDWIHALLSMSVFAASALFQQDVKACLYPSLPPELQSALPICIGFACSSLLLIFPSRRGFDVPQQPPPPLPPLRCSNSSSM